MRRVSILCFVVLALTVAFWNSPAQAQPKTGDYYAQVFMNNQLDPGVSGGSGWNDDGNGPWYYYPDTDWWNQWFYNDPFDRLRKKEIEVFMDIEPIPGVTESKATIAINWSTNLWVGQPGPPIPPLPGPDEEFIGRHIIFDGDVLPGDPPIHERFYILDYNPEWVSIDIRGDNFQILGSDTQPISTIVHECLPFKWRQLPDKTRNGIDIRVDNGSPDGLDHPIWLGDDFKCTTTGPLTGIHFWVSYLDDNVPFDIYDAIDTIHVEIYSDDPADPGGTDYSMPDQKLWERDFTPREFLHRFYAKVEEGEWWWDNPATAGSLWWPGDWQIYQIDIDISQDNTFTQKGTPDDPKIYWLVIHIRKNNQYTGKIGWKTRRRDNMEPHNIDDAVYSIGSELPHIWRELRYPPEHEYHEWEDNSIDLAFVIQAEEAQLPKPPFEPVKWSQPPVPAPDYPPEERMYLGWDEESVVSPEWVLPRRQMCADDFYCLGPKPVTKIHWWGSFRGWPPNPTPGTPPPDLPPDQLPQAFQIGFWTDVPVDPANPDIPYSHPGEMVWEINCFDYQLEFYGWDISLDGTLEAKYQFNQDFQPDEWFHQDRENEIYWVSIAADYGDWTVDPLHPWGWETRPHMFQDDAVKIIPNQDKIVQLGYVLDPSEAKEIQYPQGVSWDLAYELGTDPNYIKWEQRFDPRWDQNTDIWSQARYDPATAEQKIVVFEAIVADDWPCRDTRPLLAVEWWGSYIGFDGSPGIAPPRRPDFFLLTIWTDMPANDPANPYPYSHPDQRVWTHRAHNYVEVPVGKETINNEVVFQYFVNLPPEKFFYQEPDPDTPNDQRIYWLSVVAVYPELPIDIPYNWGWTNHKHVFMDDAAYDDVATTPTDPLQFDWQELISEYTGETWDMSFVLETAPECMTTTHPDYGEWIAVGKPDCWCCERQCRGDADGIQVGVFWVNSADVTIMRNALYVPDPLPSPGICADFDHVKVGDFRVNSADVTILRTWLYVDPVPPCSGPGSGAGHDPNPLPNSEYNFWTN